MPKLQTIICTVLAIKGSSPLQFHQPVTVRLTDFHPPLEIEAIQVNYKHELTLYLVGGEENILQPTDDRFDQVIEAIYNRCEAAFGAFMKQHEAHAV
ncbi:hypothetical protein SAMN05444008_102412 [Cnuella takakiae]|uniref:Uncharacterized protein n=1 Tax=Cnuella takakiae TaxID=1302690 RepID=A0A1M4VX13_9BACT|nr:hypothetical protein [Cnuella takakiae]OLY92473.1 hypothetical protein BUE76_11685 [Cnuella takakiae]SHE73499.1 hypothetical protein SAMN05444008_102412 [Cnuella takakiae]